MKKINRYVLCLLLFISFFSFSSCEEKQSEHSKEEQYKQAVQHMENAEFEKAYNLFSELGDYKDAKKQLEKFEWVLTKKTFDGGKNKKVLSHKYNSDGLRIESKAQFSTEDYAIISFDYSNDKLLKGSALTSSYDKNTPFAFYEYEYDEDGILVTEKFSNLEGELCIITYNEDGKKMKVETTDNNSDYHRIETYKYNGAGLLANETIKRLDSDYEKFSEYSYNDDNLLIKEFHSRYGEDDAPVTITHIYNQHNLRIETITSGSHGSSYNYHTYYEYNENGLLTQEIRIDNTHDEKHTTIYSYNEHNLLIKKQVDETPHGKHTITYKYTPIIKKYKTPLPDLYSMSGDIEN